MSLWQGRSQGASSASSAQLRPRSRGHRLVLFAGCCAAALLREASASGSVHGQEKHLWIPPGSYESSPGNLGDLSQACNVDSVQAANMAQLHPILHDLVNTTFFRLFRVGKTPKCSFWKKPGEEQQEAAPAKCDGGHNEGFAGAGLFGAGPKAFGKQMSSSEPPKEAETPCGIDAEEPVAAATGSDIRLDRSKTAAEQVASQLRENETQEPCEFEEDLPTYWVDMCSADHTKGSEVEDINLIKNPERNTGYNGSHIWEAMYKENCFEVGSDLPRGRFGDTNGMCYEERVLYRLLSGWHASTTISVCKSFFAPGTKQKGKWAPNVERYMESLGRHPDRAKNLHFSFVVMLRAIKKAAPFLHSYPFPEGEGQETIKTRSLVGRLLDSQVLSLCSPLFEAFDETRLFKDTVDAEDRTAAEQRSRLKRQFKSTFKNITELVDCVQCQRCRLHAKLFSLGLGSALKILLTPPELIPSTTSRDEVVALVNVLWKLSEAMEDAKELMKLYWKESEKQMHADGSLHMQQMHTPAQPKAEPRVDMPAGGAARPGNPSPPPVPSAPPAPSTVERRVEGAVRFATPSGAAHEELLDMAIGAVKSASVAGELSQANELAVLRLLVVQKPSLEVLLLAKHYGADRPGLFAKIALEAGDAGAVSSQAPEVPSVPIKAASLGSASLQPDAVVIGGGLAGMVAAVTLLDRGARVVLVDKQPYLGGNSGKASSGINAAIGTTVESLIKDTTKSAGALARSELIQKLAGDSGEAVSWLRDRTGVDLSQMSQLGGHTAQRTLRPSNAFVGAELTFAMGQLLEKRAAEKPHQLRIMTKTKWQGLDQGAEAGGRGGWRVTVQAANGSLPEEVLQAPSVVIASGGFGYDVKEVESYLMQFRPDLKDFPTTLGSHTTGDGIKIAEKIGAQLVDMDRVQLHPTGFVNPAKPTEHVKTLAAELLRGSGGLMLDRNGRRFTDELGTRQDVVKAEMDLAAKGEGHGPISRNFALVLNGKTAAKCDRHAVLYSKKGLLTKVVGLDGLAAHLGVQRSTLQETFEAYNEAAKKGTDSFGRTVFPAGSWPIEWNEDFYVGTVTPVIHYTMGGIAIDTNARVLSKANKSFEGLYAVGEASGGVHGDNRLAGNSLLECTVFGRHVGLSLPIQQAAKAEPAQPEAVPQTALHTKEEPAPAPAEDASQTGAKRKISAEELAQNAKEGRMWVGLYGDVYDLTEYVEEHPGGADAIKDVAGTDGTEVFETVHNKQLLESMGFEPIGTLVS